MNTAHASTTDLLRWRVNALLPSPGAPKRKPAEVVRTLAAVQGQDWYASLWAIGLRAGVSRSAVLDSLSNGEVVRSWPMRGTVHLVPAEDLRWIQKLTEKSVLAGVQRRRGILGLDERTVRRVIDATGAALSGGISLSRDDLAMVWQAAGVETPGNWRYHLLWFMSQTGIIVQGPLAPAGPLGRVAEPLFALADEWITAPIDRDHDEALSELATRFTLGRGVVQEKDFAWWAGLGKRDTAKAFAEAARAGDIAQVQVNDITYWASSRIVAARAPSKSATHLLPAFDEHLLGFTDRSVQLEPAHLAHVMPGKNGIFRPTVVRDGRTVGTWKAKQLVSKATIGLSALPGERIDTSELTAAAHQWAQFHEAPEPIITVTSCLDATPRAQ